MKILLKISGETLAEDGNGINNARMENFAEKLSPVLKQAKVSLVIGGGNFWRERDFRDLDINRVRSDQTGMVATMMNAIVLESFLNQKGIPAKAFSSREIEGVLERYSAERAEEEQGKVLIFAGGTGNPFFTTDTAAVLRALETNCDLLLKGTKVDGVYSEDPQKNPNAVRYDKLTYAEAIEKKLRIMDQSAFSMAQEGSLPIVVFDIFSEDSIKKAVEGEIGTLIS